MLWAFAAIIIFGLTASPALGATTTPEPPAAHFKILASDGKALLGHASYRVEEHGDNILLIGDSRYLDGEYDIERDELKLAGSTKTPKLISFEHTFFNPDGSRKLAGNANLQTGKSSCISYEHGQARPLTANMSFSPNTYAGASIILALEHALTADKREFTFKVFDCAPGPKLVSVMATWSEKRSAWSMYPGKLMKVEVTADLGWFGELLDRFLPHRSTWFASDDGWHYVGGKMERYFAGGTQVLLVRQAAPDPTEMVDTRK